MVPSTLLGLVLFLALLAPGFAYVLRRERTTPNRPSSPLRESLRVVFASVVCLATVGMLHTALRWLMPARTVNVRALVRDPAGYAREHHVALAWWAVALLAAAVVVAVIAADPRVVQVSRSLGRTRALRWLTGSKDTDIAGVSAWYKVMHIYDEEGAGPVFVGAQLDDGSYVQGRLYSFNPAFTENEAREILLSAPLSVTSKEGVTVAIDAQFSVVSARRIVRLDVKHFEEGEEVDEAWVGPEPAEEVRPRWWPFKR